MEALPVRKLAVLSFGLRDTSRIKMKLAGMKVSMDRLMLAGCFDMLSWLRWSKTEDAQHGGKPPKSMYNVLLGIETDTSETRGFNSAEDFIAARAKIIQEAQNGD